MLVFVKLSLIFLALDIFKQIAKRTLYACVLI